MKRRMEPFFTISLMAQHWAAPAEGDRASTLVCPIEVEISATEFAKVTNGSRKPRGKAGARGCSRPLMLSVMLGLSIMSAQAGTGTTAMCPIEGEAPAMVYLDITGRQVTLDAQGRRFEANGQNGRFLIRTPDRTYYFDPKWLSGHGTLTIVTENENRVVKCSGP